MSGQPIIIVKKKVKGHGHHGAAWKVAYADFVTAMMALFIVLWLLAQTDQESRKELSEYFRTGVFAGAPSLLPGGSGLGDKGFIDNPNPDAQPIEPITLEKNARHVRDELTRIIRQDPSLSKIEHTIRVRGTPAGVLIEFIDNNEDLLFDLNSSALKPGLARTLAALGPVLAESGYRLRIQGHTDARPFPPDSVRNNWTLSFERAEQARRILITSGFPEGDIIGVFAHGASAPLDRADPKSASNRRLSLLAVPRQLADTPDPQPMNEQGLDRGLGGPGN
ncbi:MAG TPA: flagellar motor protein MotB [Polyangiaceae bacterium]|jgi:chemotaxis protein MotB|nr:flagellar motor protein MotB [Polyangiaceae bacterium]